MEHKLLSRRQLLKLAGAGLVTRPLAGLLVASPMIEVANAADMSEFQRFREQELGGFQQYKVDLMQEFEQYVKSASSRYERKHKPILSKTEPSASDIKRNNNDPELAALEIDIQKEVVVDEFEHGEKDRIMAQAGEQLAKKHPRKTKEIERLIEQAIKQDVPQAPAPAPAPSSANAPTSDILLVNLHRHGPKPFAYPFAQDFRLSSYFGVRNLKISGRNLSKHCGIDIAAPRGKPIVAISDGTVRMIYHHSAGGKSVTIDSDAEDSGHKLRFTVCHLSEYPRNLREGSRVKKGETVIGYVGSTGRSTGPHLHLSTYQFSKGDWQRINPLKLTAGLNLPGDYSSRRYQFETCSDIERMMLARR